MRRLWLLLVVQILPLYGSMPDLSVLYLTWESDPAHTMQIHWHTPTDMPTRVVYRRVGEERWIEQKGRAVKISGSRVRVHTVKLEGLEPDTGYEFSVDEDIYFFRTLPATLEQPIRFVIGGDAYLHLDRFRKMNAQIAAQDPAFVVVGGDIAYTFGISRGLFRCCKPKPMKRWHTFFEEWKKSMVTEEGRIIPIVPVLGNHDVRKSKGRDFASLFYAIFSFPQEGIAYRVLDVGDYLSLILLDSGHSVPIEGTQTQWLKNNLAQREDRFYKIVAYHMAGYPSVYSYTKTSPSTIRTQWSPLFERYRINAVFEHHNHAYKRTYPMKEERIDVEEGIIYFGDGSWGVHPRKPKKLWYLEKAESANAVFLVTLSKTNGKVEAIGIKGEKLDETTLFPEAKKETKQRSVELSQ